MRVIILLTSCRTHLFTRTKDEDKESDFVTCVSHIGWMFESDDAYVASG